VFTAAEAVLKRVIGRPGPGDSLIGTPTATTDWGEVRGVLKQVASKVSRPSIPKLEEVPLLWKDPSKRRLYKDAAYSVFLRDVELEDSYVKKAFIKPEKHNGDSVPRVISPRNPRYNIALAQYLKVVEKQIYLSLDVVAGLGTKGHPPVVCKSMNNTERATTIREHFMFHEDCVAIGLDASRFDQHVSAGALRAEHSLYNTIYRSKRLAWLLDMQIKSPCTINCPDGVISWMREGGRMSGDMNTSLGNVSLCVAMLIVLRNRLNNGMTFINDGDDCVAFMPRSKSAAFLQEVKGFYLEHGFTMKVELPVDEMERIEFCQSQPVCIGGEWRMVRAPSKVVRQDYLADRSHTNTEREYLQWCYSVGVCGLMSNSGVPVLQAFYEAGVNNGVRVKDPRRYHGEYGYLARCASERRAATPTHVTDETRLSFYKAFGINASEQVELEEMFARHFPSANERQSPGLSYLFDTP